MKKSEKLLNSDELGEKGESHFKEICADAKLICNKSDRDRTGWDFIVEFPFENPIGSTLDSRAVPISCHVQVKTVWESSKTIQLRLTAAERLAKELKPAFIYVFKVNKDLQFIESFLVHILDNRLALILKRLRIEEAKGNADHINKNFISLTPRPTESIETTGAALRSALKSLCGSDIHAYASKKKKQVESLGFDAHPYEGTMTFPPIHEDELLDILLGLKNEIQLSKFQTFETRFDIKLPHVKPTEAKLTITPHPYDQCTITIRQDEVSPPAVFAADMFVATIPNSSTKKGKFLLKAVHFSLIIEVREFGGGSYSLEYDIGEKVKKTPQIWIHFWRMMHAFASGNGTIYISSKKSLPDIILPINATPQSRSLDECSFWLNLCEQASRILERAAVYPEPELPLRELHSNRLDILYLSSAIAGTSDPITLKTEISTEHEHEKLSSERIIFAKIFPLGDLFIAYYGVVRFSIEPNNDHNLWQSNEFTLRSIKMLKNFSDQFDALINHAQRVENIAYVMRIESNDIR